MCDLFEGTAPAMRGTSLSLFVSVEMNKMMSIALFYVFFLSVLGPVMYL